MRAAATLAASATTRGDVWSVAVTATDGLGTSAAGTAAVTIANTAPTLSSLTLSPDPATEDDVLVCTAGHCLVRQVGHRQQQGLQF